MLRLEGLEAAVMYQILSNTAFLTDCETLFIYSHVFVAFLSPKGLCPYLHVDVFSVRADTHKVDRELQPL